MMAIIVRGVVVLAGAAVVVGSSAVDIPSAGLEVRQDANSACPPSYSTRNGMNFTTYCNQNNPFNDAMEPFLVGTMQECMDRCSRYWGADEGCFGIVWREDQNCWIRNSSVTLDTLEPDQGIHFAMVEAKDMEPLDTDCPAADLSTHTLDTSGDDIGYTLHCGKDISGDFDSCWDGFPCFGLDYLDGKFRSFYHATSVEDCLHNCIKEHPLCRAVVYNPDLKMGFANCWLKDGFKDFLSPGPNDKRILHSAAITNLDRIDTTCPTDTKYTSQNKAQFDIQCGQTSSGTNLTSVHRQNITSCMDACANSDRGCVGVIFDSTLQDGFRNCYLQNTTNVLSKEPSATYAALSGTSSASPGQGGNNPSTPSSSSSSKAWIAGPVVGGILAIAILAAAIIWWRRRKAKTAALEGYATAPPYSPYHGAQMQAAPSELGGDTARELAATEHKPVKYAHGGSTGEAPQELPT
ncbi:hypothetical protein EJ04DRAFT_480129 [Polyplosphaeria fusca]|uniref:Apple domain-containing protein n=1 Tax=Polyplosphaeria fusca TaxID=682080 RepID=A0A9P4QJM6_9PLEO|nr:hypothetical protein EJ04DRAFT_480129 [Polyplosphaeria fusca]